MASLVAAATVRRTPAIDRSGFLDVVRLLAGFDIVAFHTGSVAGDSNGFRLGFGVTVFLLVTAVGVARQVEPREFRAFAYDRASRYLSPFGFWCVVYAAVATATSLRYGEPALGWWRSCMLWRGTEYHLWFMPVSLALVVVVELARAATVRASTPLVVTISVVLACLTILAGHAGWYLRGVPCWSPWAWAPPAAFLGLALGKILQADASRRRSAWLLTTAVVVAAWSFAVWQSYDGHFALRFATGSLLMGLGLILPGISGPWMKRLLALSIGVFLCHPLVLRFGLRFLDDLPSPLTVALIWSLSAVIVLAMQRTALARFAGERPTSSRR